MSDSIGIAALRETGMDEVCDGQACFRDLQAAFAEPARWSSLRVPALSACPPGLRPASYATLATLCDNRVSLWVAPELGERARRYLELNTGARSAESGAEADYALLADGSPGVLGGLRLGSEEFPERSTLALVQLGDGGATIEVRARGPGIDGETSFEAPPSVLPILEAAAKMKAFPLGIDLLLIRGDGRVCALPRSMEAQWHT